MRCVAGCLAFAAIALAAATRPDLVSRTEATAYLQRAQQISAPDQAMDRRFEPGYPLFLSGFVATGVDPSIWVPVTQTTIFMAALGLLLLAAAGRLARPATLAAVSAGVSCVPTYLLAVNGAVLTESVSASAVLLLLAALVWLWRSVAGGTGGSRALGWFLVAVLSSAYLGLVKGSFSYVAATFLPLLVTFLVIFARLRLRQNLVFFAAVALVCLAAHVAVTLWLHSAGLHRFVRGGQIVYGRSVYVSQFDFRHDSVPFLLAALSERSCQRVYGERCLRYRFDAENKIGEALTLAGVSDDELWRRGWQLAREHPVRALGFVPFELSRFAVHHTTRGFAALDAPVIGAISKGVVVISLLKILNLLVYAVPVVCVLVLHRTADGVRAAWWGLPGETRVAVLLAGAYCLAFLAVHGMATTILRMVYPIAVLPLVFAVGALVLTMKAVAAGRLAASISALPPRCLRER